MLLLVQLRRQQRCQEKKNFPRGFPFCMCGFSIHRSSSSTSSWRRGKGRCLPRANNSQKKKSFKKDGQKQQQQNFFFFFAHLQLMDFLVYFLLPLLHVWPAAHLNLGQLLGKQGRYDEAIHWLAACTQLDSSASVRDPSSHRHSQIQALILWGQMELAVRQQPARAVQLYKQALRRSPTNPQQLEVLHHF